MAPDLVTARPDGAPAAARFRHHVAVAAAPAASTDSSGSTVTRDERQCWGKASALAAAAGPADCASSANVVAQNLAVRSDVPHIPQRYTWDCGLACVLMVLRAAGVDWQRARYTDLLQLCTTTSVWTIDLAHLLARFGLRPTLLTITIGADHSYASEAFYAPHWGADAARVQQLFDAAPAAGVCVAQRSLPLDDLIALLPAAADQAHWANSKQPRRVVVVLVDKRAIDPEYRRWCAAAAAAARWRQAQPQPVPVQEVQEPLEMQVEGAGGSGSACSSPGRTGAARTWQEYLSGSPVRGNSSPVRGCGSPRRGGGGGGGSGVAGRTWQEYYHQLSQGWVAGAAWGAGGAGSTREGQPSPPYSWNYYYGWLMPLQQQQLQQQGQQQLQDGDGVPQDQGPEAMQEDGQPMLHEMSPQDQQQQETQQEHQQQHEHQQQRLHAESMGPQQQQRGSDPLTGYAGHYLLLLAYDSAARVFWVQDPAKPCGPTALTAEALEAGRRAFGTDEDLLIVDLPPMPEGAPPAAADDY